MALETHSRFYYGWQITNQNQYFDYDDGDGVKSVKLSPGYYSTKTLSNELKKKIEEVSEFTYSVIFNRITRKWSITNQTGNFEIKFATGPFVDKSCSAVFGFNPVDISGSASFTSQNVSGYEYKTQFHLQSYRDTNTNRKAIDGLVNKSSNGVIEVIKFGNERFMSCEMLYVTEIVQQFGSIVRTNVNGFNDLIQFMDWCTEKAPIEFMPNEDDQETYQEFILESTDKSTIGLDYEIDEMYDRSLPFYFKTGPLKFRLME